MPRGDKTSYTNKQKRQARHIEEGYEKRGTPRREAERRAWATVNKETGGVRKVAPAVARQKISSHRGRVAGLGVPLPLVGRLPNVQNRHVKPLGRGSAPQQSLRPAKSLAFIRLRSVWNYSPV